MDSTHKVWLWYGSFQADGRHLLADLGVGALCMLTGLMNLVNNSKHWFRTGVWNPLTTFDVLRDLFPTWSWLYHPTDYFGAWGIDRQRCRVLAFLVCYIYRRSTLLRRRISHGYDVQVLC